MESAMKDCADVRDLVANEIDVVAGAGPIRDALEQALVDGVKWVLNNPDKVLAPLPTPEEYKKFLKGRPQ
jgi:hypothetical protein